MKFLVFSVISFFSVSLHISPLKKPLKAGDLTDRFELTLSRVLTGGPPYYTQEFLLADVIPRDIRRFTNFSGDMSGRYIGALAMASKRHPRSISSVTKLVDQVLRFQQEDGHFGAPMGSGEISDDDMARLWGNGRMLIGLLEYYTITNSNLALEAASKIGDFLVKVSPQFNAPSLKRFFLNGKFAVGYICWTQNIEGLIELYRHVPDPRYLHLAEQMAERIERRPRQHSHGFLSSLRGLLALGRIAQKPRYLEKVKLEWSAIITSGNLFAQGAIPEAFLPGSERDEGCSQGDWIRLNLDLWRETGDIQYLEQAERTLFNEFSLNQLASGDFGHIELRKTGIGPEMTRAWWCCTLHGLRTFPDIEHSVFRFKEKVLYYDIPIDGFFNVADVQVTSKSSLQRNANITLFVTKQKKSFTHLAIRLPHWAKKIDISIGNTPQATEIIDSYVYIKNLTQSVTEVQLSYDLSIRLEEHPEIANHMAVFHGPWLLGISESSTPSFFDEPHEHNRVALHNTIQNNLRPFIPVDNPDEQPEIFRAPAGYLEVEWVPAGYTTQPQVALLRPLAEATSEAHSTRWEFWFKNTDLSSQTLKSYEIKTGKENLSHFIFIGGVVTVIAIIIFLLRRLRTAV